MLGDRGAPPRDNPVLDGVGAGIFGALTRLVIADIMRGTGRYNLAQGAVATAQGIGASLSGKSSKGRGSKPPRACILSRARGARRRSPVCGRPGGAIIYVTSIGGFSDLFKCNIITM